MRIANSLERTKRKAAKAAEDGLSRGLPDYAPMLRAYHREFAPELRSLIDQLPLSPGADVLDVACGDGQYAAWFAERVGRRGSVIAIDILPAWLNIADECLGCRRSKCNVELRQADARRLPHAANSFDLVWCAQSLYC